MIDAAEFGLATAGQYIVLIVCLAGAAIGGWWRHVRRSLRNDATGSAEPDVLDNISWREFEQLVGEGFRLQGYNVLDEFELGPDDGTDLTLRMNGEKFLVQCRHWRAFTAVDAPAVRKLCDAMAAKRAAGGFVLAAGRFTPEAREFASGRNVRLLDGPELRRLLKQAQGVSGAGEPCRRSSRGKPVTGFQALDVPAAR